MAAPQTSESPWHSVQAGVLHVVPFSLASGKGKGPGSSAPIGVLGGAVHGTLTALHLSLEPLDGFSVFSYLARCWRGGATAAAQPLP